MTKNERMSNYQKVTPHPIEVEHDADEYPVKGESVSASLLLVSLPVLVLAIVTVIFEIMKAV